MSGSRVAERLERAEAVSASVSAEARRDWLRPIHGDIYIETRWFGGACSVFAGHWTHLTQTVVTAPDLQQSHVRAITEFFGRFRSVPTVHIADSFDDSALRIENYSFLGSSEIVGLQPGPENVTTPGVTQAASPQEWLEAATAGHLCRPVMNPAELEIGGIPTRMRDTLLFESRVGGSVAAVGALFKTEGVGILFCDATVTEFRGRGLQRDIIAARVRTAFACGCDVVVATVTAGSASQANYLRSGFHPLYRRHTWQLTPA